MAFKIGEEFEQKDVFGKFSLDALASCAFGVDAQSFSNSESHPFVYHAAKLFTQGKVQFFGNVLKFVPGVAQFFQYFNINVGHTKSISFFRDIVLQTIQVRKDSKKKRNDLIDLILDCMKDENPNEEEDDANHDPHDQY